MGFNPNTGEKVAYFVVVISIIAAIFSSTYYYLWRRNKKIRSGRPESIGLRSQQRRFRSSRDLPNSRPQALPLAHIRTASRNDISLFGQGRHPPSPIRSITRHNRDFFRERPSSFTRRGSDAGEQDGDFTAQWARQQAYSATYGRTSPVTIYPESSVSSGPRRPRAHARGDYTDYPRRPPPPAPPPLRQRPSFEYQQQHFLQPTTTHRDDVSAIEEDFTETPRRLSYISITPPSEQQHPDGPAYKGPPAAAQHHHHHEPPPTSPSISRSHQHSVPPHRSSPHHPPQLLYVPTIPPHIPPTPSTVSPPTDIAACVNPYYLSSHQRQSRRRRWSIFGLGSDATSSDAGQHEWVVRGRGPVLAQEGLIPAPLSVGQRSASRDAGREAEEHGDEEGEDDGDGEVLGSVAYRAGGRF